MSYRKATAWVYATGPDDTANEHLAASNGLYLALESLVDAIRMLIEEQYPGTNITFHEACRGDLGIMVEFSSVEIATHCKLRYGEYVDVLDI